MQVRQEDIGEARAIAREIIQLLIEREEMTGISYARQLANCRRSSIKYLRETTLPNLRREVERLRENAERRMWQNIERDLAAERDAARAEMWRRRRELWSTIILIGLFVLLFASEYWS